ncbi:MAG: DNA polymerase I [Cytophagaceae bacterium]|nr:DNA polymerase I [Cytophagaceae bacterium]
MKKLFLLDALALIYRAHFAFAKTPRINSTGMNTSAVFGFANTLLEVLTKEAPSHIGVAFDTPKRTFRKEKFEDYKAQRQAMPEDIGIAIPYVKRLCEALCIPILILDGYEADDVIGTIALKAAQTGEFEVFMMTPDKDYGQLVSDHVKIFRPAFMGKPNEVIGKQDILDRWGIERVEQVVDILGLMGDASDNIPGLPGIGEKTAQKLIQEWGSVENIIANVDKLKGKVQEIVRAHADQGLMSKELATIHLEVPVDFDENDLKRCDPNREKLAQLLDELEFRQLRRRLLGDDAAATAAVLETTTLPNRPKTAPTGNQMDMFGGGNNATAAAIAAFEAAPPLSRPVDEAISTSRRTIFNTLHDYRLVDTPELRRSLVHFLSIQEAFCFDTETTALDPVEADLVGFSFSYRPGEAFYVPVPADPEQAQAIVEEFRVVLENTSVGKVAQNMKYDLIVLKKYGVNVAGPLYDTMLAHYLIEPEKRHNLDYMSGAYLNYEPVAIETLIGKKGSKQGNMREVELEAIKEYAGEDADLTLQLRDVLTPQMADVGARKLFDEIEMPLVDVLADMELEGVRVDTGALRELSKTLTIDLEQLQLQIFEMAGESFNIGSPQQLGRILFEKLKLDNKAPKTKTGQWATGEEVLSKLENDHEVARKVLEFRELQKLKNTYVDALPQLISPRDGRIHTSFNQAVAATGRLSSNNPNLQNIPIRTPRGQEIRKAFVPRDNDHLILSADYSQIELRIMASFSGDPAMTEAFNQGRDIHATTASKIFNVSLDQVTSDMRRKAKTVNFGIIYGISSFGLAARLDIKRTEAKEIIDAYFQEFPAVKCFMDESILKARECEYAETITGRRRYLRDINSRNMNERNFAERNAINAPIQGTAADILKVAMIRIHDFLRRENLKSKMILTVHDELVFDAHKTEVDYLKERVNDLMVHALPLAVKMETGMGTGLNWLQAH